MAKTNASEWIARNLEEVRGKIAAAAARSGRSPAQVHLVAVTKYAPWDAVQALVELGQLDLAESRPQALVDRAGKLARSIRWHMIGHWQTNKIRRVLPHVFLLHSLDRLRLAQALEKELEKMDRRLPALLEVNVAGDDAKGGFSPGGLREAYPRLLELARVAPVGLMTMCRLEADADECRRTFSALRELRDRLERDHPGDARLEMLSMGMSGDFEIAIEEGATHVRLGSALFQGLGGGQP